MKLAIAKLYECRQRVQNQTLGYLVYKHYPLYRSRRLLARADERLDDHERAKLVGLLDAGDPFGEVRTAWHAKEVIRSIYEHYDPDLALAFVERLCRDLQDQSCPVEVRSLCRTLIRWRHQIAAWHQAHLSNVPYRGGQQPDQADQEGRLRFNPVPQSPDPGPALRRAPQLGATRHPHTLLKSEEPIKCSGSGFANQPQWSPASSAGSTSGGRSVIAPSRSKPQWSPASSAGSTS